MIVNIFMADETGERTNHAVIRAGFSSEGHRFLRNAFVDDSVGKHGLAGDAKDERAEGCVISWFTLFPHTSYMSISGVFRT
jgi:hypothetical protein